MATPIFVKYDTEKQRLICSGDWNLVNLNQIRKELAKITWPKTGEIIIDGNDIAKMDSAGAWLFEKYLSQLANKHNSTIHLEHFSEKSEHLLAIIKKRIIPLNKIPQEKIPNSVTRLGRSSYLLFKEFIDYLAFIGHLALEWLQVIFVPRRWRLSSLTSVIDRTGFQALPIIALLSFMIGVVISYQMGNQLRAYGANVFIVNLLGLSVLREFGPLITAIMVAGRTGSAFTAQIGTMKLNQEIDALGTMGISPAELLLLPRIIGLTLTLPLLTMWADIFGVMGGMLMANNMLQISWSEFLHRFQQEIPLRSLLIGLGKAPIFALLIASIGCFQGMQVKGSADSVGKRTTRSVVFAIFFIIVADAIFSVIFSKLKL